MSDWERAGRVAKFWIERARAYSRERPKQIGVRLTDEEQKRLIERLTRHMKGPE